MSVSLATRSQPPSGESPRSISWHPAIAPTAAGLLGFLISVIGGAVPSIWYDEAATITSATRSWPDLFLEITHVDAVHAVYYSLMHVVFDLLGYSPFALRLPSGIAVAAAAALVVLLGRSLDRPRAGLIGGIVYCLLPRVTWMGTEGRSYAISAMIAVALTLVLVHAMRSDGARWWVGYAALAALGCIVFIYLALIVVAHALSIAWILRSRGLPFAPARRWLAAAGGAALIVLPFAITVIAQGKQLSWIHPLGVATAAEVFTEQWFYGSTAFAVHGWVGIVAGSVVLVRRGRGFSAASILLPLVVVPTLLLLVVSLVYTPLYFARYLSMCLPFVALVIAAAIDAPRWRPAAVTALALAAALSLPQVVIQRAPNAKENSTWAQVADFVASQRASNGADSDTAIIYGTVVRHPTTSTEVIADGYPAAFAGTIDVTLTEPGASRGELWDARAPLTASLPRLLPADVTYLVTGTSRDPEPATTATLESIGWHESGTWTFGWMKVVRYDRD